MSAPLPSLAALGACLALALSVVVGLAWHAASQVISRRTPDPPADPAELGLAYEPVDFVSRDGLRLGGWLIAGATPVRWCSVRGTVILCHGHAGSLDSDLRSVLPLQQQGYDVLQFDFRGHGRSEGQHVSMGYYERLDLLGAVDFLRGRGVERIGVLGHSMGGAVAISSAACCSTIVAVVSDGGFARLRPTLESGFRERGLPGWLAQVLAPITMRIAGLRLHCNLSEADPLHWIGKISPRPVFLIHGEQDVYVSQSQVERLYDAAGDPKTLWVVPQADHRRADKVCPEDYTGRVLAFFDRWLAEDGDHA